MRWLALVALTTLIGCGSASVPSEIKHPSRTGAAALKMEAPAGVELWRVDGDREAVVCVAPCSAEVSPKGQRFEARVREMPDSPSIVLPPSDRLVVKVETAPRVLLGLGVVTGTAGTMGMLVGGLLIGLDQSGNRDLAATTLSGGIILAAGSAVLAAGIVLAALSGTHVEVTELGEALELGAIRF